MINPAPADMEQDQEDGILIGEEGKKRVRGENEDEINNSMNRNRRVLEGNYFLSAAAKRHGRNKNLELKCPWIGESTGNSQTSASAEDT